LVRALRYRELLRHLVLRNLKVKYQRSLLGFFWTLLNPLLTVSVIVAVLGYVLRAPVPHYWAFLLSGYLAWNFFVQVLGAGPSLLREHTGLLRSARLPAEVLALSAIVSRLAEFSIEISFAVVALIVFHHGGFPLSMLLLPLLVGLQVALAFGLVLPLATLAVFYDDVQHALPPVLLILFYVCPVLYPVALVPEVLRSAYHLNPIASLLTLYQTVLYEGRFPPAWLLAWTGLISTGMLFAGYAVFRRNRSVFPEIL
jgi:ABC-type polysaccharide/polyol phosphate export permease